MTYTEDGSYVSSSTMELKQPASAMSAQPPSIPPFLLRLPSVLLCLLILTFDLSNAQFCYDTGNFTAASTYAKNRELVLSSLPSDVTSKGGFYSGNVGNGSDVVYVLSFCRGDSSNDSCFKCINSTAEDLRIKCPYQKAAVTWGTEDPPCIIRYADVPMYGVKQTYPTQRFYNTGNISMDQDQFDLIWRNFTEELATTASMGTSKLKFATGRTVLPNFQTMFALLQCSPDLNQTDCQSCLRECINDYQDCCRGKQGGPVQKPSCIFRWDLYRFFNSDPINLPLSPPPPTAVTQADPPAPPPANAQVTNGNISKSVRIVVAVVGSVALFVVAIVSVCCLIRRRRSNPLMVSTAKDEVKTAESLQFKISEIRAATNSFAEGNKLGEGGFGKVYRGRLPNGQEIAVKRLSQSSGQGLQEFKNEIVLVAKLQHRNLVRLLGFCFEEGEKLLVYELMPNKSLDYFVFDLEKSKQLDWPRRYNIISGIARGMLYLHEDSRLRIIHRDLKASNILLDNNMNPKISDFGMARIFGVDQTNANTRRIVGTYGYMSPEYAMHGQFSQKSDVYSFGVLLLEIICGKRNDYYYQSDGGEALASYAWKHWRDNVPWEILDPVLGESYSRSQVLRCIHIGFLCVQEDLANRPTMASIVLALSSQTLSLPVPREPAFFLRSWTEPPRNIIANDQGHDQNTSGSTPLSVNGVSITELSPR
ncbi:hypothetical protein ACJRO7_021773 [Eucalyptus globulus]|uniref:Uncharacterized protein n=1 Tax=Eucalyptus globulus TaxID=34317 RepID=A0ABD3KMK9_EUCGL